MALLLHRPLLRESLKSVLLRFPRLVSPPRRLERTGRWAGDSFSGEVYLAALAALHEAQVHGGPMLRLSVQALVAAVDDAEVWVRVAARRALIACVVIAVRCALPFQRFYPCANASVRRSLGRP